MERDQSSEEKASSYHNFYDEEYENRPKPYKLPNLDSCIEEVSRDDEEWSEIHKSLVDADAQAKENMRLSQ